MDTQQNSTIVEIDPKSGFCFGVINAIKRAEQALTENATLYCLGDIVHNGAEVARLEEMGLQTITREQFYHLQNCTVLLRAHGEPPETYEIAKKNNITIIDATCPVVLQLQKKIKKGFEQQKQQNGQVLLFGKHGHAEVVGLQGQTNNEAIVVTHVHDIDKIDVSKPIELFSQTTKSLSEFKELQQLIIAKKQKTGNMEVPFISHDTICRQVANRETELRKFASKYDLILFVSGKKSSNGKVLFDICKEVNPYTFFISSVHDIESVPYHTASSIGVCGATSTPKWLMEDVARYIHEHTVH
ncbi:MAG TPA: 4-hydroxy-3-methylbut-2-enyl diphosphate reductase [Bacteroidales bacterium]|jgi:4-hydroxy-3-methylbut-2-enyl diphosphate reductase|nr:4-hydroxy-3-methylbut-2-enyl diphosphate reductase [Bacteroidales bacterium]